MTPRTHRLLAGLTAVAVVLIVGGLVFDRHLKQAHTACMGEVRDHVSESYQVPGVRDPDAYTGTFYSFGCDQASRAGLVAVGIGVVLLVAAATAWWGRRRTVRPGWR